MAQADLRILKDGANQEGPRAPSEIDSTIDEWFNREANPLRKVRRLDVDAVLARSLPKALGDDAPETKSLRN